METTNVDSENKIDSKGPFQGALTFTFISQNDSSFLQFKDPLGRKALLMWLTPQNVTARNLIDHKQYNYGQILEFLVQILRSVICYWLQKALQGNGHGMLL